jgi:hypothetical protein
MTRAERTDLLRLVRQRAAVSKSLAKQRAAEMLAEFETQLSANYSFDSDAIWKDAFRAAEEATKAANKVVSERCRELGIPERFASAIDLGWYGRGENAAKNRRAELRRVAITKIAALENSARSEIDRRSLEAVTEIIAHGLESETAKVFLERFKVQELMPSLVVGEVENLLNDKRGAQ